MSKNGITKNELLQRMARRYREETGLEDGALESTAFASWLLKHGWKPPRPRTSEQLLVGDIGRAMRSEYRRDNVGGFDYRANVAFRTINRQTGEQRTFWVDPDCAPKGDVHMALSQRRNQILGDVVGLANDAEHFNRVRGERDGQISMTFDFTDDLEDKRALRRMEMDAERRTDDSEDDDDKL